MFEHGSSGFRTSRIATLLCFALAVSVGASHAPTDGFANSSPVVSDDTPVDPAAVRALEAKLVALSDEVSADLDARVAAMTDGIAQEAADQQTAALLARNPRDLAMPHPISNRFDRRPIEIARGSLAVSQQIVPAHEPD